MKLTAKEEKFVQGIIAGKSQRQAYKDAYNTSRMKDGTIDNKACELFKKNEVRVRYQELLKENENKSIITRDELLSKAVLALNKALGIKESEIATIEFGKVQEHIAKKFNPSASAQLIEKIAKLQGWDIEKKEITGNFGVSIVDDIDEES